MKAIQRTHTCPFPGCLEELAWASIACHAHYGRVSSGLRAKIKATAGNPRDPLSGDWDAYVKARQAAMAELAKWGRSS